MILRRRRFNLYSFVRMFCMAGVGGATPAESTDQGKAGESNTGAGDAVTVNGEQKAAIIAAYEAEQRQKGNNEKDLADQREKVIAEYKAEQEKLAGSITQVQEMARA